MELRGHGIHLEKSLLLGDHESHTFISTMSFETFFNISKCRVFDM